MTKRALRPFLMRPGHVPGLGVISVFRGSPTKFPRPGLTSGSAAVCGIPKVFERGADPLELSLEVG